MLWICRKNVNFVNMRKDNRLFPIAAILIAAAIFGLSVLIEMKLAPLAHLGSYATLLDHGPMLLFSVLAICIFKDCVPFHVSWPRLKTIIKPILLAIVLTLVINVLFNVIIMASGGKVVTHPVAARMNFGQTFLLVFLLASIAEEFLCRGFLQNALSTLKDKGIKVFGIRLSLPVIISAVFFGLMHLILLMSHPGFAFVARILTFTTVLGLLAGYYQEKYDNFSYAVIVHMAGNLLGLFGALMTA